MEQGEGTSASSNEVGKNQLENPQATPISNSGNSEIEVGGHWPLSGKPYFSVILTQSHVDGLLTIPAKIARTLPSSSFPVALTYCGKTWDTACPRHHNQRKLDSEWKKFVRDNNLKAGDACVFELMESSNDGIIGFRVQILRGDFPPELEERISGETAKTPIVID